MRIALRRGKAHAGVQVDALCPAKHRRIAPRRRAAAQQLHQRWMRVQRLIGRHGQAQRLGRRRGGNAGVDGGRTGELDKQLAPLRALHAKGDIARLLLIEYAEGCAVPR